MGMGLDLAASKVTCDEVERLRRVEKAANAVADVWFGGGPGSLDRLMQQLLESIKGTPQPAILWDVDPRTAFARVGGKLVATVTEQDDGTWVLFSDSGRNWPAFRSLDAARLAFEEDRAGAVSRAKAVKS